MKTFNEKDLITWSNRDKAGIGNEYYFGASIDDLKIKILDANANKLEAIIDTSFIGTFKNYCGYYPCILPANAVEDKIIEPTKKYRPCKNIQEFYEVINNYGSDSFPNKDFTDENFIYNLLGTDIHIRSKVTSTEYYTTIITITVDVDVNNYVKIALSPKSYQSFNELFETYEIEINGEWKPFGVIDED